MRHFYPTRPTLDRVGPSLVPCSTITEAAVQEDPAYPWKPDRVERERRNAADPGGEQKRSKEFLLTLIRVPCPPGPRRRVVIVSLWVFDT